MRQWKREMCFVMPDGDWRLIRPTVNDVDVGLISAAHQAFLDMLAG
ncbi:hypothetical protein [Citrobacter sp. R-1.5.2]|nr:hypothetical protein [Citrobacter sp. R-1.5.2]MEB2419445.1 hypothetical protein [Citrobacter sp. R-1.5.2]